MASYPYNATVTRNGETYTVTADNGKTRTYGAAGLFHHKRHGSEFSRHVKNLRGGQMSPHGESRRCHWTQA